jgi:VCBS repeat-containing protein
MPLHQLDTENADRNLTTLITVLTHTPDASKPTLCQGYVEFGDGAKNLSASGGSFQLTITVGGQTIQPDPQVMTFSTAVRAGVWTTIFPVPANKEVILRVLSPNAADSDVDVTAYLFEVTYGLPDAVAGAAGGLSIVGSSMAVAVGGIASTAFAAGAIDAASLAADAGTEIANAVKAAIIDLAGNYTIQQALSIILAAIAGVTTDGGTTLKTPDGTATRIAATINGANERTVMTLTPSA